MQHFVFCIIIGLTFLTSCSSLEEEPDYYNLPTYTETGINMIVEIPAGTNRKFEYDDSANDFTIEEINGKPRVVNFLPYPGNYGFIPSTFMDEQRGGDGDPLDVILMCASLPTGSVVSIKPIGMLELIDRGELDTKLIAIPADTSLQVIQPEDFQDFIIKYDGARNIIETWFMQYKGVGQTKMKSWQDEKAAMAEIKKWTVEKK